MKGIVHFSFALCFTAAVRDFGTLALGEAPGFLDLLILHVSLPFPSRGTAFQRSYPTLSLVVALTQHLMYVSLWS